MREGLARLHARPESPPEARRREHTIDALQSAVAEGSSLGTPEDPKSSAASAQQTLARGPEDTQGARDAQRDLERDRRSVAGDVFGGRYQLQRELGRGGMGVVWLAHDRELQRDVAVKVLSASADAAVLLGMRREARAVAQLSHPNVVAVYDVDLDATPPFIVMEYLAGGDLRSWLRQKPAPPWRAILETFEEAGVGLAAAHEAGLVHRDFKPGNVLVGGGRARVVDFGLARQGVQLSGVSTDSDEDGASDLGESRRAVGTPAYMAPEQHLMGDVTAAADQFAFACSVYEGLYGQWPFRGATMGELVAAKCGGPPTPPRSDVPSRIYTIVARGLQTDPTARWPSMRVFVAELRRARRPKRTRWIVGAVAAASVLALLRTEDDADRCRTELDELQTRSPLPRGALESNLEATNVAPALRDATLATVDEFGTRWREAATEACDTVGRSDLLKDCLVQVHHAAAQQLATATRDRGSAEAFAEHVHLFPAMAECSEGALQAQQRLPADLEVRREIEALRAWATEQRDLEPEVDGEDARAMMERARATQHLPTLATVQVAASRRTHQRGDNEKALSLCDEAFATANAGGADWVALRAAMACTSPASMLGNVEAARQWEGRVEAFTQRVGEAPLQILESRALLTSTLARAGALDEARARAAQLYTDSLAAPAHDRSALAALAEVGMVAIWLDDYDAAVLRLEEGLRRAQLFYPDDASMRSMFTGRLATAYRYVARYAESEAMFERTLSGTLAPDERTLTRLNYALMLADQPARRDDARDILAQTQSELEARGDVSAVDLANVLSSLGQVELKRGRRDEARAVLLRARALYSEHLHADHISVQNVDQLLARVDAASGADADPGAATPVR